MMILCAWTVGAIVSLAPIFGWKDPDFAKRVIEEHKCMVSQDVSYQIFATISTFYAPLVLLLGLYWRIFQVSLALFRLRAKEATNSRLYFANSVVVIFTSHSTPLRQLGFRAKLMSLLRDHANIHPGGCHRRHRAYSPLSLPVVCMCLLLPP